MEVSQMSSSKPANTYALTFSILICKMQCHPHKMFINFICLVFYTYSVKF